MKDDSIQAAVRRVCERYPTYGYRRVAAMLRREGLRVNHKRVCRLMRGLGLGQPRIRTQRVGSSQRKVAGGATGPNQVWQMDLTRIWVDRFGWLNVVAIIDVWDRCVVAHLVALRARAVEWVATLDQAVMALGHTRGRRRALPSGRQRLPADLRGLRGRRPHPGH